MSAPESTTVGLPRVVWSVAGLLRAVGDAIQARLPACTVQGELSALSRPASGHLYFSLKDADGESALLRCAMFRRSASMLDFVPREGLRVQLRGRVGLYEPRGELQFIVESMQPAGDGALYERFLRLKAQLEREGLFDPDRKRTLPPHPTRVGVVTSLGAAALHDVCTALARRAPHVAVVIYPSLVQGAEAPAALVQSLALADRRAEVDLLLLVRGGGSLEDLWAFNDERVVRAVAASRLPVVCGVGHETDFTLCDFAADLRAATPTAAAELAVPARDVLLRDLAERGRRLAQGVQRQLDRQTERLDRAWMRLARPQAVLAEARRRLDRLGGRLATGGAQVVRSQSAQLDWLQGRRDAALRARLDGERLRLERLAARGLQASRAARVHQFQRLDLAASRLRLLDPAQVLGRGYAVLLDGRGHAVTRRAQAPAGTRLSARLADGTLQVDVVGSEPVAGDPALRGPTAHAPGDAP